MRSNFFSSGFGDFGNFGNFGNFGGGGRGTSRQVRTETKPDGTVVTTIIENGKKTTTVQKPSSGTGNKKTTGFSNQNFDDFFNNDNWGFDISKRFGFGNEDKEEEDNNNNNNNNNKQTYTITYDNNNNNNNSNKKYVTIGNIYQNYDEDTGDNNNNQFTYDFNDNNNNNNKFSYDDDTNNNNNQISSAPVSGTDFQREALEQHNIYRRKHHVGDLVLNEELNNIAQNYANKLAATNSFQHSNNSLSNGEPLGENLFMVWGVKINGKTMSTDWYNEVQNYNYNGDYQSGKGHFTQLVWKGTKQVGFGYAQARDGSYYGVANYYPAGNYMGEFRRNVLKP